MKGIVARRAARGAEFMDQIRHGWFNEIRLDDLDISSGKHCIMTQIYGDYWRGLRKIGILEQSSFFIPIRYGFDPGFGIGMFFSGRLTRAWRREIERRRVESFCTDAWREKYEVVTAEASG